MARYYPSHSIYKENSPHYLWFSVQPLKLSYHGPWRESGGPMQAGGSQNFGISSEPDGERFMFLAPMEFQDTIQHNWEPMENILSRLQDIAARARRELSMSTQQHIVDTALLYQDSNRREISFTVHLGPYDDPVNDVMYPINELRKLSSPKKGERGIAQTKVGNPHIFKVDTVLGTGTIIPIINIKNAALESVQPSFQGPFISGQPSKVELTLNFKDMEPLMKESFENESRVSVGSQPPGSL